MTRNTLLTRRAFATALAGAMPAMLLSSAISAQTPSPSLIAVSPYDLRDTLAESPITTPYEGVMLEPVRWIGTSASPYLSSVGGVHVLLADRADAPFGSYLFYHEERGAEAGAFLGKQALRETMTETHPVAIEGYDGEVITYEGDESHSLSLIPVRTVLVIGHDTPVSDTHHDRAQESIDHTTLMIRHLLPILDRQT